MPFTPITEELLRPVYVSEELPVLAPRIHADIADQWKGLIELARAVLDPRQAFQALLPLAQNRIDGFDAGNSLTNSLYWVATRPPVST
jgi:endoglucanase Acf2